MNTAGLIPRAAARLRDIVAEAPSLDVSSKVAAGRGEGVDFVLNLNARTMPRKAVLAHRKLLCRVKGSGQPRVAREACLLLGEAARSDAGAYPVFIAPYISPAAAAICERYGTGYVDFAGNCRIAFDAVFIKCEGFPNHSVVKRDLRSFYSPKAERVLRVLLGSGPRPWRTQALADTAQVSLGQVASVKKLLLDREWVASTAAGFGLAAHASGLPDESDGSFDAAAWPLLEEWARNYVFARNEPIEYYSLKPVPEVEVALSEMAVSGKERMAFTGLAAAARFAPAVRYQRVTAYVAGDVDAVARALGLKRVSSGANVALIRPYDDGVFFGAALREGAPVVSAVQAYLDLMAIKGRGEEAAKAILEDVIRPQWL